jgi:hypothetical protein
MELITGGPWLLTAYGFDDDSTGTIEDHENLLQPCQQDNTIIYHSNGTGTSFENQLQCGGDTLSVFEWRFIDSERAIQVLEKRMDLHKLDQRELHFIIQEPFLLTPLHASYKRLP